MENAANYTMSPFSSWGVPGNLTLKPEITAPGGNIYSVAGTNWDGTGYLGGTDQYELMSGTSMAAPQITGMTAVLKRYIETTGLSAKKFMTDRALAQSLLMSTATPMVSPTGYIYSPMQQGAGLANVSDAMNAATYVQVIHRAAIDTASDYISSILKRGAGITNMNDALNAIPYALNDLYAVATTAASAADGKVKAELGDDPAKTGVYSFSFTMTNMTKSSHTYYLNADLFTQATDGTYLYGGRLHDLYLLRLRRHLHG